MRKRNNVSECSTKMQQDNDILEISTDEKNVDLDTNQTE